MLNDSGISFWQWKCLNDNGIYFRQCPISWYQLQSFPGTGNPALCWYYHRTYKGTLQRIHRIMYDNVDNEFFGYEWGDLPTIFASNVVIKSLANHPTSDLQNCYSWESIHYFICSKLYHVLNWQEPDKNKYQLIISPLLPRMAWYELDIVTSHEHEKLVNMRNWHCDVIYANGSCIAKMVQS